MKTGKVTLDVNLLHSLAAIKTDRLDQIWSEVQNREHNLQTAAENLYWETPHLWDDIKSSRQIDDLKVSPGGKIKSLRSLRKCQVAGCHRQFHHFLSPEMQSCQRNKVSTNKTSSKELNGKDKLKGKSLIRSRSTLHLAYHSNREQLPIISARLAWQALTLSTALKRQLKDPGLLPLESNQWRTFVNIVTKAIIL